MTLVHQAAGGDVVSPSERLSSRPGPLYLSDHVTSPSEVLLGNVHLTLCKHSAKSEILLVGGQAQKYDSNGEF